MGGDLLDGGDCDDQLYGDFGADILLGGDGNDTLYGGVGGDYHDDGSGNDTVYGDVGDDTILGGIGADLLYGGPGDDLIEGGADDDTIYGDIGRDTIRGGSGNDSIYGGPDDSQLSGGDGNDTIFGSFNNDVILGETGDDYLQGDAGNDIMSGGDGSDVLVGDPGNDRLDGGNGNDTTVFRGRLEDYDLSWGDNQVVLAFDLLWADGTDIISKVERFMFPDVTYSVGDENFLARLATSSSVYFQSAFAFADFGAHSSAGSWTSADRYPRELADVNGDGRADVVAFGEAGVFVALANGDGSFSDPSLTLGAFSAHSWTSADRYPRALADVNGDDRADVVAFGQTGVYVALATEEGSF